MAAVTIKATTLADWIAINPRGACIQDVLIPDSTMTPVIHRVARFANDYPINPELITGFVLPSSANSYATAFIANFVYYVELPYATGNVVWEFSAMSYTSDTSGHAVNAADSWGTVVTVAANAVPTTPGRVKNLASGSLVIANVGLDVTPIALQYTRFRIRRMNSSASDTCESAVYILGGIDLQDA